MDMVLYLVMVNMLTLAMYWQDKRAAKRPGAPRVPEAMLLGVGFAGGTLAAIAGQQWFRHKTRKTSFQLKFWALTLLQIGLLIFQPQALQLLLSRAFA